MGEGGLRRLFGKTSDGDDCYGGGGWVRGGG